MCVCVCVPFASLDSDAAPSHIYIFSYAKIPYPSLFFYIHGQVDYGTKPEELQVHFKGCGIVNRVTILTDKFGNPKGFAYVEFQDAEAVANALLLSDTEFRGRTIKVSAKRTNQPGMKKTRFNPGQAQMMNPMMMVR